MLIAKVILKQVVAIGHLKGVKNMKIRNPDLDMINFANQNKEHMYDMDTPQPPADPSQTSPISKGLLA
jgi:hypothetical protein